MASRMNVLKQPRAGSANVHALAPITQDLKDDDPSAVKLPEGYHEPMAEMVARRFEDARRWRNTDRIGDASVQTVLERCYQQAEGMMDPCMMEAIEETGVDIVLNQTLLKVEAAEGWSRSIISDSEDMPFTVERTPIPEVSKRDMDEAFRRMKRRVFDLNQSPVDDLWALARQVKSQVRREVESISDVKAKSMERLMFDQCVEGKFRSAMTQVIRDFFLYPAAFLEGPVPVVKNVMEWSGNRLRDVRRVRMVARRISPFDAYPSSDSPDTQQGSYVVMVRRMTLDQLFEASSMKSYIGKNVVDAVKSFNRQNTRFDWLQRNPERVTTFWREDEEIEVLRMHGKFSGRELATYGLQVDDGRFYEATIETLGGYVIAARINKNPNPNPRPIHSAAMSRNGDRIWGIGVAQKVRDPERAFHSVLRALIRNSHYSSGPIGEVDFTRIQRFLREDMLGMIDPYTIQPVDPDVSGGGRPAHYFHTIPNTGAALLAVMQYFERIIDRITQIPAAFHGEALGTGVNRTFRGVTLLQGNALKGLQTSLTDFGRGVIAPFAETLFIYNMHFSEDDGVKGDAKPRVRDIAGLLQREVEKQEKTERLMLVAQIGQTGELPKGVMSWVAHEALKAAGVPIEDFADAEDARGGPQAPLPGTPEGLVSAGPMTPRGPDAGMPPQTPSAAAA